MRAKMARELHPAVTLFGQEAPSGAYVLRILVDRPIRVSFGAATQHAAILVAAGAYAYVGSAMGRRGASSLAARLLRHATRSGTQPPHAIRGQLIQALAADGVVGQTPRHKTLHWHVDYLLDHPAAELSRVCAVRTERRLEPELATLLERDASTYPLLPGLGASDHVGHTHLMGVADSDVWWQSLLAAAKELAEHPVCVHGPSD